MLEIYRLLMPVIIDLPIYLAGLHILPLNTIKIVRSTYLATRPVDGLQLRYKNSQENIIQPSLQNTYIYTIILIIDIISK